MSEPETTPVQERVEVEVTVKMRYPIDRKGLGLNGYGVDPDDPDWATKALEVDRKEFESKKVTLAEILDWGFDKPTVELALVEEGKPE